MVSKARADISAEFIVVGGGLTGIACAAALSRVGHRVRVFERKSHCKIVRGLLIPPMETRVLQKWGLEPRLKGISTHENFVELCTFKGQPVSLYKWYAPLFEEAGSRYTYVTEPDLHHVLAEVATSHGAEIRYEAEVVSIDPEEQSVTLASGETFKADAIFGADGLFGLTREVVGGEPVSMKPDAAMYTTAIPRRIIDADPELAGLVKEDGYVTCWFGEGISVLVWTVGSFPNQDLSVQIGLVYDGPAWNRTMTIPQLAVSAMPENCDPRIKKMVEKGSYATHVPHGEYPRLQDWVHDDGNVVVIGNAAYPCPAGSVVSDNLAIEDAGLLSALFSHLSSKDQIPSFLEAFQELRQSRRKEVSDRERGNLGLMSGPVDLRPSDLIDAMAAMGMDVVGGDENATPEHFDSMRDLLGYEAEDAADDWWASWGLLRERAKMKAVEDEIDEDLSAGVQAL